MTRRGKWPRIVLLPGLDGTGELFDPFVKLRPEGCDHTIIAYPLTVSDYGKLSQHVLRELPLDGPFVLVAESFSGPVAVSLAARGLPGLLGVVLVASFVRSPANTMARLLPWAALFSIPPPAFITEQYLLGRECPRGLVEQLRNALQTVPASTLAARVRATLEVDVTDELRACRVPMMYLRALADRVVGQASGDLVQQHRPAVIFRAVEAPHLLLQRAPEPAWEAIADFVLSSISG